MTQLSKTDLGNLEAMIANMGAVTDYKGQIRSMQKMIEAGFVTKHTWNGKYVWQITAAGRAAAA